MPENIGSKAEASPENMGSIDRREDENEECAR